MTSAGTRAVTLTLNFWSPLEFPTVSAYSASSPASRNGVERTPPFAFSSVTVGTKLSASAAPAPHTTVPTNPLSTSTGASSMLTHFGGQLLAARDAEIVPGAPVARPVSSVPRRYSRRVVCESAFGTVFSTSLPGVVEGCLVPPGRTT